MLRVESMAERMMRVGTDCPVSASFCGVIVAGVAGGVGVTGVTTGSGCGAVNGDS